MGQNEDYGLGDSIPDLSEKLLQRVEGKVIVICNCEGGYVQSSTPFVRGLLLIMKSGYCC